MDEGVRDGVEPLQKDEEEIAVKKEWQTERKRESEVA